jgi:two-component system phosphate regulon sensor histidine kinase PhoR
MKKLRWSAILMSITILGITGFQAYWLKQNYAREEKALAIKSEAAFRETIQQLQVTQLKLDGFTQDLGKKGKVKVIMTDGHDEEFNVHINPKREIVSTINVIQSRIKDSLKKFQTARPGMIISMNKTSWVNGKDSLKFIQRDSFDNKIIPDPMRDHIFNVLYGVDSLQDSLKLKEINTAYALALKKEKIDVPFVVARLDSSSDEPAFNEVTVGFVHPITFKLKLGNTFPYLIRRISLPILFSILLLGITILTFVLLYKNLLRQRKLAELKNEFISNITHELKTPIATVGVAIEALKNFNAIQDPERTKEYLDISQNELQRLSMLVDKVLKLSMFESKRIELKKEEFDLKELVEETMNVMKLQFEKHKATVSLQTEAHSFMIEADRLHITSVLYNLLDNALKYSKENPVIDVKLTALPRDIYELKISDNGIGIAKEYQRKIFDKFFRVPMGNQHNTKGYGLGLSYVYEIIQRHMGYITVDSELGKGTTFTVKLPRREADVIYFDDKRKMVKESVNLGFRKKDNKA